MGYDGANVFEISDRNSNVFNFRIILYSYIHHVFNKFYERKATFFGTLYLYNYANFMYLNKYIYTLSILYITNIQNANFSSGRLIQISDTALQKQVPYFKSLLSFKAVKMSQNDDYLK